MCVLSCFSHVRPLMDYRLQGCSVHGDSPGKNTEVGLPNWGIEPQSLISPALAGKFFTTSTTWKAPKYSQYDSSFTKFKHMKTHNIVFKEKWIGGKMTKKSKGMLSQKSGGVCLWIKREGIQKALATWCEEPIHWKRPWCWERLRAGGVWAHSGR